MGSYEIQWKNSAGGTSFIARMLSELGSLWLRRWTEVKIPEVKRPSQEILIKVHSLKGKKGLIAVIERTTGKWFLGKTLLEPIKKAKRKYPDKIFYSIRIGSPFAHEHKGGIKKIWGSLLKGPL